MEDSPSEGEVEESEVEGKGKEREVEEEGEKSEEIGSKEQEGRKETEGSEQEELDISDSFLILVVRLKWLIQMSNWCNPAPINVSRTKKGEAFFFFAFDLCFLSLFAGNLGDTQ